MTQGLHSRQAGTQNQKKFLWNLLNRLGEGQPFGFCSINVTTYEPVYTSTCSKPHLLKSRMISKARASIWRDKNKIMQFVMQDNIVFYLTDKSRVAIWGWSYGGFVTASVLARDAEKNNIFKVFPPLICISIL
jgi:hypothetical protein